MTIIISSVFCKLSLLVKSFSLYSSALGILVSLVAYGHLMAVGSKKIVKFLVLKLLPIILLDLKHRKVPLKMLQSVAGWLNWVSVLDPSVRSLIQPYYWAIAHCIRRSPRTLLRVRLTTNKETWGLSHELRRDTLELVHILCSTRMIKFIHPLTCLRVPIRIHVSSLFDVNNLKITTGVLLFAASEQHYIGVERDWRLSDEDYRQTGCPLVSMEMSLPAGDVREDGRTVIFDNKDMQEHSSAASELLAMPCPI